MAYPSYVDLDRFVHQQRLRAREAQAHRRAAAALLRGRLPLLVSGLVERGARRVVLFGSLALGAVDDGSDVDVAVEGLPVERHIEAMSFGLGVMGRPVDVVRLEEVPPTLRVRIEQDGEVLHGNG